MNNENIAGTAATGLLVFLGTVVAPHASGWGATTTVLIAAGATLVTVLAAALIMHLAPRRVSEYQLQIDAEWDHAWSELDIA